MDMQNNTNTLPRGPTTTVPNSTDTGTEEDMYLNTISYTRTSKA
jgi:hypothetical protein